MVDFVEFLSDSKIDTEKLRSEKANLEGQIAEYAERNDFTSDGYINTSQKLAELDTLLSLVDTYKKSLEALSQAEELMSDEEMAELAANEAAEASDTLSTLQKEIQAIIIEPLRNDEKKAILEFRPGVGGVEASLFAEDLFRMYTRYCTMLKLTLENISLDYAPDGGIKEAIVLIKTPGAYGRLRFEGGVHRVQRVPVTESAGRIHTSTASIAVMPFFDRKSIEIKDDDIKVDVFRAGGPGGQSVNTTDSAVRVTHIPSGLTVSCQSGKSQHKNKEMALSILASRLQEIEEDRQEKAEKNLRTEMLKDSDRSAKIRTYNFPQSRITDHRIKKSWYNMERIMNGEIGDIVTTVALDLRSKLSK